MKYRVYLSSSMIPSGGYTPQYFFKTKKEAVKFQSFKNKDSMYTGTYYSIEKIKEVAA